MSRNHRTLFIVMTVIWMAMIFYFSSIPDLKSSLPSIWDLIFRKVAHMLEYGILYFFLWKTLNGYRYRIFTALVLTIMYAISDEYHQTFVAGRSGALTDVALDSIGAFVFAGFLFWRHKKTPN